MDRSLSGLQTLVGPALARYWNTQADAMDAAETQQGQGLAEAYGASGDIGASIDQQRTNLLDAGNQLRMQGMPDRRGFLASLHGAKVSGLGEPGFVEGRIAPGTTDTLEEVGPEFDARDFDSGNTGPGSVASRSGLSQQALKRLALAGGR